MCFAVKNKQLWKGKEMFFLKKLIKKLHVGTKTIFELQILEILKKN